MARPVEYDYKLCEEICGLVAIGNNIKDVLDSNRSYPDFTTWCRWKRNNIELYHLYINSIQDKAEALESELDSLRDKLYNKDITYNEYRELNKVLIWKMGRMYPKMFGTTPLEDVVNELKKIPIFKENPLN